MRKSGAGKLEGQLGFSNDSATGMTSPALPSTTCIRAVRVVLPLLVGYAFATGLSVASLRAVSVAGVLVVGELTDRPTRPLNSLGGAAAGVLLLCLAKAAPRTLLTPTALEAKAAEPIV